MSSPYQTRRAAKSRCWNEVRPPYTDSPFPLFIDHRHTLATNHIVNLEKTNRQLQQRLAALESEVARLRALNEKISLGVSNSPSPGQVSMDSRPLSPPPEGTQQSQQQPQAAQHQLASVAGQDPPVAEDSPSASESGY